jgi:lactate racemase
MSHPSLITLDNNSRPRVLFAGDRLVEVDLPAGTRVLYSKPPIAPLKDVDAAIRHAISHPYGSDPLYAKLRPGMKLTIAVDDISLPLPPMRKPDIRQRVIEIVLQQAADYGVEDIEIIIATSLHRRMKAHEVRHMVGDKVFSAYWPDRLYNHDPENPAKMVTVGETEAGEIVELNRRAVESDLVVYVNLNFVPMDGGHKSVAVGLCGYKSLRAHHTPRTMRNCHSYMDPSSSALATSVERMGKLTNQALNVFTIETTINNRMFGSPLEFLAKNEDDLTHTEWGMLRALVKATGKLPQAARQAIFERVPAPYGVTGVFAGDTEAAHEHTLKRCYDQYLVPIESQADVLVAGIPYISPYNVNAFLNPLLVSVMAEGYLFNMYRGAPLVKKGGTLIITHPCTDKFDHEQHAPYIDFVHQLLPETRDGLELHKRYEAKFAQNPAFLEMFRKGHAYHPAHPFFMWYWGEAGRRHLGKVIVVGADNEYIPKLLGYETAPNMSEALYRARDPNGLSQEVLCMHLPPIVMGDVRLPREAP